MHLFEISLIIELIYYILIKFIITDSLHFASFIDIKYLPYQFPIILGYLSILLLIKYYFKKLPLILGILAVSFILFRHPWIFLQNTDSVLNLVMWMTFALIFAWHYIDSAVIISLLISSFGLMVFEIRHERLDARPYSLFLWIMFVVLIVSIWISSRINILKMNNFLEKERLLLENDENKRKLTFDHRTGMYSHFAIEEYMAEIIAGKDIENTQIVVIRLDNLSECNYIHGFDVGDIYMDMFCNIISSMAKNDKDRIGRISGNDFIAVIKGYKSESIICAKLDRLNVMLREEFNNYYYDSRFHPNLSYGIAKLHRESSFRAALAEAEKKMYTQRKVNLNKRIETNFYKSYIDYASLFNSGSIVAIVWMIDEGWPIAYVTANVSELLGYGDSELVEGRTLFATLIHPDDIDRVAEEYTGFMKELKKQFEQKYRVQRKDGSYIWIRDVSVPLWENEELKQINGYIYDVNSEMEAEKLLEDNNIRMQNIIETTNSAVWEWNLHTGDATCNDYFYKMLGYTREELTPLTFQTWEALIHPDDLIPARIILDDHLSGKRDSYELESRMKHKDGHWIWVHDKGQTLKWDDSGNPLLMCGLQIEITEHKKTEALLHHSEKLFALGRLSGVIAHDLNNQLMMIDSLTELSLKKDSLESYRENFLSIKNITDQASQVINQLMSFTKNHLFKPEVSDLKELFEEIEKLINHSFGKGITTEIKFSGKSLFVHADQALLKNAFMNICINAKESMTGKGHLKIHVAQYNSNKSFATLTGDLPVGDYVKIEFKDNGEGIGESELNKVFEPFFTTKESGKGLGLSSVVSVVKEHHGGITIVSSKKKGTSLSIFLPLHNEEIPATALGDYEVIDQNETLAEIMIIDDETVICAVIKEYFELHECSSVYFTNPLEGIEYFREKLGQFKLVILDMSMPEMNGDLVFEKLVELKPDIKVLFMSGYSQGIEVNEQNKNNIVDFFKKPVKLDQIYNKVAETLGLG